MHNIKSMIVIAIFITATMIPQFAFADETDQSCVVDTQQGEVQITVDSDEIIGDDVLVCNVIHEDDSIRDDAQNAINEFISEYEPDPAGTFAYDRLENVKGTVKNITVISPEVVNEENETVAPDEMEMNISFDNSEDGDNNKFTKNELLYMDTVTGETEVISEDDGNVNIVGDGNGLILQAEVVFEASGVNNSDIAGVQKYRDIADSYLDVVTSCKNMSSHSNVLDSVADIATKDCDTDYEKIYAVNEFVAKNIFYDYTFEDVRINTDTAYKAWNKKRAVCGGYSCLCQYLLNKERIPCRVIITPDSSHAFNAAYDRQNHRWVYFDSTWSSMNKYTKDGKWTSDSEREIANSWFLGYSRSDLGRANTYFDYSAETATLIHSHLDNELKPLYVSGKDGNYTLKVNDWCDESTWIIYGICNKISNEVKFVDDFYGVPVRFIRSGIDEHQTVSLPKYVKSVCFSGTDVEYTVNAVLPETVENITGKPGNITANLVFLGNPPTFNGKQDENIFSNLSAESTITYPCTNPNWTASYIESFNTKAKFVAGHTNSEVIGSAEATEEDCAYTDYRCSNCGKTFREYVEKAENPIVITTKAKNVSYKKVKRNTVKVSPISVNNKVGEVKYSVQSGNKKILKVNATTGKITVKKGTKKGKYSVKVKVVAKSTTEHKSFEKVVTAKVTVK